jgi:DNA/RNA-binding protein KIN17
MNATQWKSLSQFAAHLGKEGICRVEETEKGLFVSWIDNSPETMRKREAIMKKERQDKGDEEREQRLIREQVERAQAMAMAKEQEEANPEDKMLQREDGEKVTLNFGFTSKPKDAKSASPPSTEAEVKETPAEKTDAPAPAESAPAAPKISMSFGAQKPKNVFASAAKKNPLAGKKGPVMAPQKKMTEQERIMKAEMEANERKRSRPDSGFNNKRPKISLK